MSLETEIKVKNLIKGAIYRVRYRAVNSIGSGEWSDLAYIRVAQVPEPPPTPVLTAVENTIVSLQLSISTNDGGTGIIAYHLFLNEGVNGSPFNEITDYDGSALTYDIAVDDVVGGHTVATGNFYAIKYIAENAVGMSLDSDLLYVALARQSETPAAPVFDETRSTRM